MDGYYCPTNLECLGLFHLKSESAVVQRQSSELALLVHQNPFSLSVLYLGVESGHGDVIDPEVALVAPTQREPRLPLVRNHRVNNPARVLLQVQRLQNDVVVRRVLRPLPLHQVPQLPVQPELEGVTRLAELALEVLPGEGVVVVRELVRHLRTQPLLHTLVVNELHASRARARLNLRVFCRLLGRPAYPARNFLFVGGGTDHVSGLVELQVRAFGVVLRTEELRVGFVLLNFELHSS